MKRTLITVGTVLASIATLAIVGIHAEEPSLERSQTSKLSRFTKQEPPSLDPQGVRLERVMGRG